MTDTRTAPAEIDVRRVQRRTVAVLMVSQALGGVGVSSGVAVATLLAEDILGSPGLAGLAQTGQVLGAALAAFLLARVMAARGRRAGLIVGYGTGGIGAALCVLAGVVHSFPVLLLGTLAIGSTTAANNQARYVATDLAQPDHRARALALVVWATTIGSVLGPNLAAPGAAVAGWLGTPALTGAFAFTALGTWLATTWIAWRLRPDPLILARQLAGARGESRPSHTTLRHVLGVLRLHPRAAAALVAMASAHAIMVSVMVMTPLQIHHAGPATGETLRIIGLVLSAHVLGMYAFAPLVGWAVDRAGHARVLATGAVVLLAALLLAGGAPAGGSPRLFGGLFLLGLGWSSSLVASSALLVDAVPLAERPGVQGGADLLMGVFAAGAGALAGVIVANWGYAMLNGSAAVLALSVLGAAYLTARSSRLPPRPNLDQLKHPAKELQQSSRVPLHEAQTMLGSLEFAAAIDAFLEAATDERRDRAERILTLHPGIATANLYTALVLGDSGGVNIRLDADPSLATRSGGPRGWEPIHYVCYTALAHDSPARAAGLAAIARRLIALGVDPNTKFPWLHHNVRRPVLWGASRHVRSLPLVQTLLDAGADPNDGVTLPLAASAGDIPVLEALHAHGAQVDQPWATDGSTSLYAILNWSHTSVGVMWLLEHGADPNARFGVNGETPLHVAARAWDVPLVEAMVARGADSDRKRADGRTPYAVAELNGNRAVADWLLAQGASPELSDVDRLVAACSRGDRAAADTLLAADPRLREEITDDHYIALHQAAERGDVRALEALLACGFDPNRPDASIGKTALHTAAMEGWPEAVRVLLAHGASVHIRDREFHGQPLVWAAEGSRQGREGRDFAAVGTLLLDAGSPIEWQTGDEPAEGILGIVEAWRRAP